MVNPLKLSLAPFIKGSLRKTLEPIGKGYLSLAGFRQVGLRYDDLIQEENDEMQKALARLSPREEYDRAWRLRRAINQSILHKDLPKEQWSEDEASKQRYLTDRITEVANEHNERAMFDNPEYKIQTSHH
ncbi:14 kDa subunit of cytochrome bd ubiquinol oxidase [Wallemia mellicola]|nr:14 kDa subunit of cytochrome bd ubiquinol oxidase [Wallemia mellicola]